MKNKRFNLILIAVVTVVSLWSLWPTWRDYSLSRQIEHMATAQDSLDFVLEHREQIEDARQKSLKLGLDLKGGMHLVMEIDQIDLFREKAWNRDERFEAIMDKVAGEARTSDADVLDLLAATFRKDNIRMSRYFYDIRDSDADIVAKLRKESEDALLRAKEVIRNRIDQYGVAEPSITTQGSRKLIIELPGVADENRVRNLLKGTAKLEFKLLRDSDTFQRTLDRINSWLAQEDQDKSGDTLKSAPLYDIVSLYQDGSAYFSEKDRDLVAALLQRDDVRALFPQDSEILMGAKGMEGNDSQRLLPLYLVRSTPELTGGVITEAKATFGAQGVQPEVIMAMNSEGTAKWARITGANIGKRIAIVLDGAVYSAPVVQSKIPNGNSVINGIDSLEEAKDLEIVLKAGALPAPVRIVEERTVGPSLGADYIRAGMLSLAWGFFAVVVFMMVYYHKAGLAADVALVLNVLVVLSVLAGFGAALSLPGIAGIVLTMGMAVDANVLIYERIREELASGRQIASAISQGYDRAFSSILDSHVTTLVAAFLLYTYGIGPVQGFAVTLMIGTASSLFTAIVVTREIFQFLLGRNLMTEKSFG